MRRAPVAAVLLLIGLAGAWWGLHGRDASGPEAAQPAAPTADGSAAGAVDDGTGLFVDVTARSGIVAQHKTPDGLMDDMIESVGSGAIAFDYDGDGRRDIYVLRPGANRLYRNRGGMSFEDVTQRSGTGHEGHAFSAAAADYDNDGDVDLFVFNQGPNVLYRNKGDGTFEDVTAKAGIAGNACSVAGTLFDNDGDGDGWLDLYVGNYLTFDPSYKLHYAPDVFPGPLAFAAEDDVIYRNKGDGTFEDVTARTGLDLIPGRTMGVVATDFDGDGICDIFTANDASANFLLRGEGGLRFREVGAEAGVAFGFHGEATGAMAGAVGDFDLDGLPDMHVTDTRYGSLYRNLGKGLFHDSAYKSGIATVSAQWVSWGGGFLDFDNDGDVDLILIDGDLHRPTGRPDLLLENVGGGRFENASARGGAHFYRELLGRAGLLADFDDDGAIDVFITMIDDAPVLLRNRHLDKNHWVTLALVARDKKPALGARVTLTAGGRTWVQTHYLPSCYLTQDDPRIHFGLGSADRIDTLEIRWPSGRVTKHPGLALDQIHVLREEDGGA